MEYRHLGRSGFKVPVLSFGTGTFGGEGKLFGAWGNTDVAGAKRLVDICLDAGLTLFDSADVYSSDGPNDVGSSRFHLVRAVDAALQRLGSDYIDLFQLHGFDAKTPIEETVSTLDDLVRAGKIRYLGVSNFSGWHLMKSLAIADRHGWSRYVANQTYYSLIGRDYEWELMPLGLDQGVGAMVWSPLGWGRLTGKIRRGRPLPANSRLHDSAEFGPPVDDEQLYRVVDALDDVAAQTGRTIPQIAINWLLQRPTVSSVIIGARDEEQLKQNLGAVGWSLTPEQIARLDEASRKTTAYPYYPYWHQAGFAERNPPPV